MEGSFFTPGEGRASRLQDLAILEAIKRQFVQKVINGEIEISASDVVRVCQEVHAIREALGLDKKEERPIDKEGLVKAFLAAIEAAEAPPDEG